MHKKNSRYNILMTIYALSTGPGISGVAIIRISGPEASNVIKSITGKEIPKPRVATLRKINNINTSELIDEGIIIWFPGPESYTGEDMAEFHVHGSKAVIEALHSSIEKINNCRLAEPGEFTKLAFLNGKINLLKPQENLVLVLMLDYNIHLRLHFNHIEHKLILSY